MLSLLQQTMQSLYQKLPEVSCRACGRCCVSPTCTLSEFIYLFSNLLQCHPPGFIETAVLEKVKPHESYEGNLHCPFLINQKCSVHPYRTAACRLFGVPSVSEFQIDSMVYCPHAITVIVGSGSFEFIQSWLSELITFEGTLYAFNTEPYYIKGMSLQSWLDIYFDTTLNFDVFYDIHKALHTALNLDFLSHTYVPQTGIREKIDKISVAWSLLSLADHQQLPSLLHSILNDYPLTGTYYYEEAMKLSEMIS
ncbi:MAG: YkgJ family cysteine cluster protein [Chitinivibrionales bacterium]|nr:YkgJ family cysteine cluster protein [Chitinivibrionales bacterium]